MSTVTTMMAANHPGAIDIASYNVQHSVTLQSFPMWLMHARSDLLGRRHARRSNSRHAG